MIRVLKIIFTYFQIMKTFSRMKIRYLFLIIKNICKIEHIFCNVDVCST